MEFNQQYANPVSRMVTLVAFFLSLIIGIAFFKSSNMIALFVFVFTVICATYGEEVVVLFADDELELRIRIGDVGISYLKFAIIIFNSDKKITESELTRVEKYMGSEYDEEIGHASKKFIEKYRLKQYKISSTCSKLYSLKHSHKLQLIYQLFALAYSDGILLKNEEQIILQISNELNINSLHFKNIKAMFSKSKKTKSQSSGNASYSSQKNKRKYKSFFAGSSFAYLELGVSSNISAGEIKIVYRNLAKKYHPDKWVGASKNEQKKAKEKFQRINNAYELIKKKRM